MARKQGQTWLTYCIDDMSVASVIVLAKSIRNTRSTRDISVIVSRSLSIKKRQILSETFDAVIYMDETETQTALSQEDRFKLFAFSLRFFEKIVFLSPTSILLENVDQLFEFENGLDAYIDENGHDDMSMFSFSPTMELYKLMWNHSFLNMKEILENNKVFGRIPCEIMATFSVCQGVVLTHKTHAPIIQLIDAHPDKTLQESLASISDDDLGLREKKIRSMWLDLFQDCSCLETSSSSTNKYESDFKNEPIAIVGMSCRYPGANSNEEFWQLLVEGRDGMREPPAHRWTKENTLHVTKSERKTNAGFLSTTVDEFDARFFGVSPKEAVYMDPQARLLHEVMWESLEDAGIDPHSLYGSHTGIFVGSWINHYRDIAGANAEKDFFRVYMGNSIGAAAARLSFLLGLTGPSIATESGCSSAMVALDLAVKSLRSNETNLALAGGVNLLLHPFTADLMNLVFSEDGRCKTFDAKADGFGRAEGCGVLALKRLSDAQRDRDNIWAIIRGSAIAQEGISKSLGTPTVHCEALAMQLAQKDANVRPEDVSFVETHGTGTSVGDPMEVAAITKAYHTPLRREPLIIGSVKTNVGHTESCSGITGIMKTILAMKYKLIPKHLNLESLNPEIFLDRIPAVIPLEPIHWPKVPNKPRIAGVSSFGITGTDGHVIIQEPPDYHLPNFTLNLERPTHLLTISGKTEEALELIMKEYENLFLKIETTNAEKQCPNWFANAAYSANNGRASFSHRAVIIANTMEDALTQLRTKKCPQAQLTEGENRSVCFLFPGQGSQYGGMAKSLYETSPVFRVNFDICDKILKETYALDIKNVLWENGSESRKISQTIYSQTAIFCVEYCLLRLWQSWGIHPDLVLGHSLGEFCAAVCCEILSFEDALKLVVERSRLIQNLPNGSMAVVKASKSEVENLLSQVKIDLDFAAVNSLDQTVLAGDTSKIEAFLAYVKGKGGKGIILESTHAFHSKHMDPILEKYRSIASSISYKPGKSNIQYISGLEGKAIYASEINADYWVRHTRNSVSFMDACAALVDCTNYIEIGPHPVLSSFVMTNKGNTSVTCLPSLRRGNDDWNTILNSLGKLYLLGYAINWQEFDRPYERNKVSLPFHPFKRKSYWAKCVANDSSIDHPLVGRQITNASSLHIFQNDINTGSVPYLKDHCIGSQVIFPGAGFTEMSLTAGHIVANSLTDDIEKPTRALQLNNLLIETPLELQENKVCRMQVIVDLMHGNSEDPSTKTTSGFHIKTYHRDTGEDTANKWLLHSSATLTAVVSTNDIMDKWEPKRITEIMAGTESSLSTSEFYKTIETAGLKFGESFRMLKNIWTSSQTNSHNELVTEMAAPSDNSKYLLHPLIIDAAFQSGILAKSNSQITQLLVPVRVGKLTILPGIPEKLEPSSRILFHVRQDSVTSQPYCFICTSDLVPIALMEDVEFLETSVRTIESILKQQTRSLPDTYEEVWNQIPCPSHLSKLELIHGLELHSDPVLQNKTAELRNNSAADIFVHNSITQYASWSIVQSLYQLGWRPKMADKVNVNFFINELKILPGYSQLIRFYLTVLEKMHLVKRVSENLEEWFVKEYPPTIEATQAEIDKVVRALNESGIKSAYVELTKAIGESLSKILIGEESALKIMFPVEETKKNLSVEQYYLNYPLKDPITRMFIAALDDLFAKYLETNQHDSAKRLKILEVGAGTGLMTFPILEHVKTSWGDRFEYHFTDLSPSFFKKAEEKMGDVKKNVRFNVFNIEESPLSQGVPLNYFDIVIAGNVLHATRDLHECLAHLRQTIRPGGVLFFNETMIQSTDITFMFGLLEGYWRFNDFNRRPFHCCAGEQVWIDVLSESGFQHLNTFTENAETFGIISAKADPSHDIFTHIPFKLECKNGQWMVFAEKSKPGLTESLSNILICSGYKVTTVYTSDQDLVGGKLHKNVQIKMADPWAEESSSIDCVFDASSPIVGVIYAWGLQNEKEDSKTMTLPFLHIAKHIIKKSPHPKLFVLTEGVNPVIEDGVLGNPTASTLLGMTKTLKNELNDFVRFIDLEFNSSCFTMVDQVLFELAMSKGHREQLRAQIAYRDGSRYEARMAKTNMKGDLDELPLPSSSDRYNLVLPKTKVVKDLEFSVLDAYSLGEDEVEVKVSAYALNFRDIFAIIKPGPQFEHMNAVGTDFAGVICRVGSQVTNLKVGERVFGDKFEDGDRLPSHLAVKANRLLGIPDYMTEWEASTLPAVFATVHYCLITHGKMCKDDTVLIHTASGGVGLAAIQMAKLVGAKIITTAGSNRKRAYLKSLGIDHVFHSRNTSYEKDILEVTNGRGVDIVLNSITGPGFKEASLNVTAKNGRFIEMSKLSVWTHEEVKALRPDVDYFILDLMSLNQAEMTHLFDSMEKFVETDKLYPIPFVKFDALNIRQALYYFQKAKHIGKVVCVMPEVLPKDGKFTVNLPLFTAQSTYFISGGLGGIGFEVCKWMLNHGARNIILSARNPPKNETAAQIAELVRSGYNIIVKLVDIGDYDQCAAVLKAIPKDRPLRGVMHCAGVLSDGHLAQLSWENFKAPLVPKVTGSWNLHNLTKELPLEHFVVFSSAVAMIGSHGQSNHSAANRFQDSLIHYRNSVGLVGTSINWGQWSEVGCAKDANLPGVVPVSVKRMLNGLKVALRTQKSQISFCDFSSYESASVFCPILKGYLDDKLFARDENATRNGKQVSSDHFWREMDASETIQAKMEILSGYLKEILRNALRMDQNENINDDANIRELGVDSLMMLELKNSIQSMLGSRLTLSTQSLKDCTTVRLLSTAILERLDENDEDLPLEPLSDHELSELCSRDCVLPEVIVPSNKGPCAPSQIETVFITGSTGQLGPYIIAELFKLHKNLVKVVCLVRSPDTATANAKLKSSLEHCNLLEAVDMSKIDCVVGDVAMENLGISDGSYEGLCGYIDAVIHCAAKRAHLEPYRQEGNSMKDIRSVNVGGTLNVLKFACHTKTKHIFYASNLFCAVLGEDTNTERLSDTWQSSNIFETIVPLKLPGAQVTKFVCESLLHEASQRGIPCKVFRFAMMAGDSETGWVSNNFFIMRYLSYLKIGAMPSAPLPAIVVPVDTCAQLSLQIFLNDTAPHEIFNLSHPRPQVEQEFVKLANIFGKNIDIIEWPEFYQKLQENDLQSFKDLVSDQRAFNGYLQDADGFVKGYVVNPQNFFVNEKISKYIPNYETLLPDSMEIIRRDLQYCKDSGVFDQLAI